MLVGYMTRAARSEVRFLFVRRVFMKLRIVSVLGVVALACGIASQILDSSVMAQGAAAIPGVS